MLLLSQFFSRREALKEHSAAHDDTGHISSKRTSTSTAGKKKTSDFWYHVLE